MKKRVRQYTQWPQSPFRVTLDRRKRVRQYTHMTYWNRAIIQLIGAETELDAKNIGRARKVGQKVARTIYHSGQLHRSAPVTC